MLEDWFIEAGEEYQELKDTIANLDAANLSPEER